MFTIDTTSPIKENSVGCLQSAHFQFSSQVPGKSTNFQRIYFLSKMTQLISLHSINGINDLAPIKDKKNEKKIPFFLKMNFHETYQVLKYKEKIPEAHFRKNCKTLIQKRDKTIVSIF